MSAVTVIGCVQVDLLLAPVLDVPLPGTATFVDHMNLRVGGAGANAALALIEAGMTPRLVGAVGDDHFGRWVARAARGLRARRGHRRRPGAGRPG